MLRSCHGPRILEIQLCAPEAHIARESQRDVEFEREEERAEHKLVCLGRVLKHKHSMKWSQGSKGSGAGGTTG